MSFYWLPPFLSINKGQNNKQGNNKKQEPSDFSGMTSKTLHMASCPNYIKSNVKKQESHPPKEDVIQIVQIISIPNRIRSTQRIFIWAIKHITRPGIFFLKGYAGQNISNILGIK